MAAAVTDSRGAQAQTAGDMDLVLLNGKIITVSPDDAIVQAVAVRGGKIAALGSTQDIRTLAGSRTRVIDLGGKCVTPGLVDSHIHLIAYGRQFRDGLLDIRFPKARSKNELLRLVEARAREAPNGEWIAGNQGFNTNVSDAPNRFELDAVAPRHPVYLRHSSGQFSAVNTLALKLAGIDRQTRDPYGGKIGRDTPGGEPNGLLFHYPAENLVGRLVPGYGIQTDADRLAAAIEGQRRALVAGYTSAQDVIVSTQEDIDTYRRLAREGGLKMRVYVMRYLQSEQQAMNLLPRASHFKDEWLTFGGWKLAVDGGPGAGPVSWMTAACALPTGPISTTTSRRSTASSFRPTGRVPRCRFMPQATKRSTWRSTQWTRRSMPTQGRTTATASSTCSSPRQRHWNA